MSCPRPAPTSASPPTRSFVVAAAIAAAVVGAACGGDGASSGPSAGENDCGGIAAEGPAWTAEISGAEEGELGAEGNAAGFWGTGNPTPDIGYVQLQESGRAEVMLFMPASLLSEGGTFDLAEPLPDVSDNALLLAEYGAPVTGEVVVCPGSDGEVTGSFDATAVSVIDDDTAAVRGTFSALVVAE